MVITRRLLALTMLLTVGSRSADCQSRLLKVGTNATGAPWSFHDATTDAERGVAVDLIKAIAGDASLRIEFVPLTLSELIPALNAGKIDLIAGNLLITPERQAQVDFSDAIATGGDGLVVPKTVTKPYTTLEDLKGLKLATQAGPFATRLRDSGLFPELKVFPTGTDAMQAVNAGECEAAIVGANGAGYELHLGHFPQLQMVPSYRPMVSSVDAFAVRKGDQELLRQVNLSLAKMKTDGTVKRILSEYGQ